MALVSCHPQASCSIMFSVVRASNYYIWVVTHGLCFLICCWYCWWFKSSSVRDKQILRQYGGLMCLFPLDRKWDENIVWGLNFALSHVLMLVHKRKEHWGGLDILSLSLSINTVCSYDMLQDAKSELLLQLVYIICFVFEERQTQNFVCLSFIVEVTCMLLLMSK